MKKISVSADRESPLYNAALLPWLEVFVNGDTIDRCVFADETAGLARVYGHYTPGMEEWPVVELHGEVEIRLALGAPESVKAEWERVRWGC